jgi:hypothetical protein
MEMPVLEQVQWGPLLVKSEQLGGEIKLPLTDAYMVKCRYVPFGKIPESNSGFWQLPAEVDQSFEIIFGYEIPLGRNPYELRRLSQDALISKDLTPTSEGALSPGAIETKSNTVRLPSLRIVVCVSLVCCKERFNFEPGEVLGAGRLYPLIMVIANLPLDLVTASVSLARPKSTMPNMGGELMSVDPATGQADLGSVFFTDRNKEPSLPLPFWDAFFDYYLIDPTADEYLMTTRPSPGAKPREIKGAVNVTLPGERGASYTLPRNILKQPGQGEFDSIHMAPKMTVGPSVLSANPKLTGLDRIAMAPFCVHDCFHMHWRWATWHDKKSNKGWVGKTPFAQSGAPLVRDNQEVLLEVHSPVRVTYTAKAVNAVAGEWQIFLHHGGAYALYVSRAGALGKDSVLTLVSPNVVGDHNSWAVMYWWLRYGRDGAGKQYERLTWTPAQLNLLREKGSARKTAASSSGG